MKFPFVIGSETALASPQASRVVFALAGSVCS